MTTKAATTTTTAYMDSRVHPVGSNLVLSFPQRSSGIHRTADAPGICSAC